MTWWHQVLCHAQRSIITPISCPGGQDIWGNAKPTFPGKGIGWEQPERGQLGAIHCP